MTDRAFIAYNEYSLAVQSVLSDYQFIEEGLRMYLAHAYELVRVSVGKKLPFKYSYQDTEKDALGKLISRFEKLTDAAEFIKELRGLFKRRNEVAHQSFLLTAEQLRDAEYLSDQVAQLKALKEKTSAAVAKVFSEVGRVEKLLKGA